jgi:mannosyltransferase OCH1-like enzyme
VEKKGFQKHQLLAGQQREFVTTSDNLRPKKKKRRNKRRRRFRTHSSWHTKLNNFVNTGRRSLMNRTPSKLVALEVIFLIKAVTYDEMYTRKFK